MILLLSHQGLALLFVICVLALLACVFWLIGSFREAQPGFGSSHFYSNRKKQMYCRDHDVYFEPEMYCEECLTSAKNEG